MINVEFSPDSNLVILKPSGDLTVEDFDNVAKILDPQIENFGSLSGIIIYVKDFPHWKTFGSMVRHIRFVRNHHRSIEKVAIVTDSILGDFGEYIASHFVSAEIRHFDYHELGKAEAWISEE